jgi:hypothetical protein
MAHEIREPVAIAIPRDPDTSDSTVETGKFSAPIINGDFANGRHLK